VPTLRWSFLVNWKDRAGWSENWYKPAAALAPSNEVGGIVRDYVNRRIGCLVRDATILACRVTDPLQPKKAVIIQVNEMGTLGRVGDHANPDPDVPNIAQQVKFETNGEQPRFFLQRGLDDRDVVGGIVTFAQNGQPVFSRFWNMLINDGWQMRDMQKTNRREVTTVSGSTGVMTATAALPYGNNQLVVVNSRTAGNGKRRYWVGKITNIAGATGKLVNYKFGNLEGGDVFQLDPFYAALLSFQIPVPNWAKTRQTGRPFFLSRGRQPAIT